MNETRYAIPAGEHEIEIVIRRSRFIGSAAYTPTVAAARAFIADIRRRYPDATHHVYAFAVGYGASVTHGMSDDGEPSGTAGKPTLAVVRGSGLGDVTVVTTRYFGGTKLGTGGLVKAYTEAAQLVLAEIPRTEKVNKSNVSVTIPYRFYEPLQRLATQFEGEIIAETFAAEVQLTLTLPVSAVNDFSAALSELTGGQIQPEIAPDG